MFLHWQVGNSTTDTMIHDMEVDGENVLTKQPDWALLSFQGLLGVLTLAVSVFTKVTYVAFMNQDVMIVKKKKTV